MLLEAAPVSKALHAYGSARPASQLTDALENVRSLQHPPQHVSEVATPLIQGCSRDDACHLRGRKARRVVKNETTSVLRGLTKGGSLAHPKVCRSSTPSDRGRGRACWGRKSGSSRR